MMRKIAPALLGAIIVAASATLALAGKYREAPELAALVKAGKLPPVQERLPKEPLVAEWSAKGGRIGKYGGVFRRATWDPTKTCAIRDTTPLIVAKHSFTVGCYPNLAKSYEMRDGGREWIIHLRDGLKWSDGHPYTVDDIIFWHQDIQLNSEVTFAPIPQLKAGGEFVKFEKLDDYTLRIRAKTPYLLEHNGAVLWYASRYPKHYLKQFHARYIGEDAANKMAKERGFPSWGPMLAEDRADPHERINPDKPSLEPWVLTKAAPSNPVVFTRNPYYWAVDKAGNQLPYINEMRYDLVGSAEVIKLKALAGEVDHVRVQDIIDYPMFKKAEREGKLKVLRWGTATLNALQFEFNLTHKDPVMRKIFLDKRFRFAVSHAVNREMINELVWLGMATPWQVAPCETSRYYNERLAHVALDYDLDEACRLLDEMGLDQKDADGFRLRPDGKRLEITFMAAAEPSLTNIAEIVMEDLERIGLKTNLRMVDYGYLERQRQGNDHDAALIAHSWGTLDGTFLSGNANHLVAVRQLSFWCPEWVNWYQTGGKTGVEPVPDMIRAIAAFEKARSTLDPEEQVKWFRVVTDIAADNLWTIGTNKYPGNLHIISPRLKNVPAAPKAWHRGDFGRPDLWFFED